MNVRLKVTAVLVVVFGALAAAQFIVHERVLLPSFVAIEQQAAITDMNRAVNALDSQLEQMAVTGRDWGNWAETWKFLKNHDRTFAGINLNADSLISLRINALAFVDLTGKYVAAAAVRLDSGAQLDIDFISHGALPQDHPWRRALRDGQSATGYIGTNQGVMLAMVSPVLDGVGGGPHRGLVLMGRLLTATEVRRIGEQAQVDLRMRPVYSGARGDGVQVTESSDVAVVTRNLLDVNGVPLRRLQIDVPRRISGQGKTTAKTSELFLVGTCIAALLLLMLLLQRLVIDPLQRLQRHAVAISRTGDLNSRFDLARNDEIGVLAKEMDHMVQSLAQAQRRLVDVSFSAGAAEMSSGVLHNIGNAMTPVAVTVVGLQDRLRAAPAADVELVLAELESAGAESARTADLQQFLRLTSRELARTLSAAGAEVEVVARQISVIQTILAQQSLLARVGPVIEAVRLPELVSAAADALPSELKARLALGLDSSLAEVGAVCVARVLLQQVFQNLLLNAAESVRDGGATTGSLRISCNVERTDAGEELLLEFHDDGVGIAAEDLPQVFARGYSTKSAATNSGIGLHWCANTVAALGGSLRAHSEGRGQGARMLLRLPLRRPDTADLAEAA
ncbi:MAG: CHASE4 domain-containing protein [Pseudomonadota bacterium]